MDIKLETPLSYRAMNCNTFDMKNSSPPRDSEFCAEVALARGKRESGQDLSGAAISVVLLCEGLFRTNQEVDCKTR